MERLNTIMKNPWLALMQKLTIQDLTQNRNIIKNPYELREKHKKETGG